MEFPSHNLTLLQHPIFLIIRRFASQQMQGSSLDQYHTELQVKRWSRQMPSMRQLVPLTKVHKACESIGVTRVLRYTSKSGQATRA